MVIIGDPMKGAIIILIKGYDGNKRLGLNKTKSKMLIDALASDLYKIISETNNQNNSWDCLIATPDKIFSERCKKKNMLVLNLNSGDLNSIFVQIQNWTIKKGYEVLILCAGDIPLLQCGLIEQIKRILSSELREKGWSLVICPSRRNGVSVIGISPPDLVPIKTRKGTANFHIVEELGPEFSYQLLADIGSYLDLDQQDDLFDALMLMEKNPMYKDRAVLKILKEILTRDFIKK